MDERIVPLKAVKLLFDATKTIIPVITGLLVVFSGTLGSSWVGVSVAREHLVTIAAVALLGLGSLGCWTGVMPFCIMAVDRQNVRLFDAAFVYLEPSRGTTLRLHLDPGGGVPISFLIFHVFPRRPSSPERASENAQKGAKLFASSGAMMPSLVDRRRAS